MNNTLCPSCGFNLTDNYYFCPNCGKKLKEPPISFTKEIGIYAFSLLLPPLGLLPGIRYLMQADPKIKRVGLIAVVLTIVSTVFTLWITMGMLNSFTQALGQYQNLGY